MTIPGHDVLDKVQVDTEKKLLGHKPQENFICGMKRKLVND